MDGIKEKNLNIFCYLFNFRQGHKPYTTGQIIMRRNINFSVLSTVKVTCSLIVANLAFLTFIFL